jgi:hypothetical protein
MNIWYSDHFLGNVEFFLVFFTLSRFFGVGVCVLCFVFCVCVI